MNDRKLLEFFEERRAAGEPLVLATVYETAGSTYSKVGAQMLIDSDGLFQGMLSGGCLEGDLALRARAVLDSGKPDRVSYDLSIDNEDLWGLGVGCDGLMRVFLQPLTAKGDYAPFSTVADLLEGHRSGVIATVIEAPEYVGGAVVTNGDKEHHSGVSTAVADRLCGAARSALAKSRSVYGPLDLDGNEAQVLLSIVRPVPHLLVLGAGLDAAPVVRFGHELGWRSTVADHRPGYLERGDLVLAEEKLAVRPESLADSVDLDAFDAAIVMSHHLVSDEHYLGALSASSVGYVGLLGPPARRQRLMDALGDKAGPLEQRLHGPAGLDLGGRGPAAIALSIVAEIQAHLAGGDGS